ncbi:ABC transporter substrate-binding protein [Cytobacillus sp. IB215316]|uniref:ABC transporter substrate-binding protein n=1 Tax=Cytobacillus sp. IB215316 TaxID=3097354 RepID=UPI002A108360|nr:extracellular solute-binding protein [Cytobacillus sp. IB215316]MDX8362402.1 extracellular solute-binding protein [Cytobacillus sp. IB215316]
MGKLKALLTMLLSIMVILSLAACGTENSTGDNEGGADDEGKVTLTFFSANPDRSVGVGKVEQEIIDVYMEENPNIKIEVEALQDEQYKNKIKIYSSTNKLPDIMHTWGQESFIAPLIDNDLLLELNQEDYADYGFVNGSLDGYSKGGKTYGLPKNADLFVLYYNKKIFAENNIEIPKTQNELLDVIGKLRAENINPISINGMDGWSLPIWFEYVLQRETGDFSKMDKALSREDSFTSEEFIKAAEFMKTLADAGGFQDGFLTSDYGAARNLFGQEQAAMYLMGSWEMGLAADENFSESFRENVGVMPYPSTDKGSVNDVAAWFGGGYSISNNSKNKEEAVKFLQYFFKQENWVKSSWQSGATIPAQQFDSYLTGDETELQNDLIELFNSIETSSGTPVLDKGTPEFKEEIMQQHQQLLSDQLSPEDFVEQLDDAAEKNNNK